MKKFLHINKSIVTFIVCTLGLLGEPTWSLADEKKDDHHDHPATGKKIPSPGLKDVAKFLKFDAKKKEVIIPVIATYNDVNYGMNFNGHHRGMAVYTVPKNWKITVNFENRSPVPHSVIVVERAITRKLQMGEAYWEEAVSKDHLKGIIKKDSFSFTPDEAGKFAFACGFPTHAANGHWIALNVDKSIKEPTLTFLEKPQK